MHIEPQVCGGLQVPTDTMEDVHQSLSRAEPPVKLWQKLRSPTGGLTHKSGAAQVPMDTMKDVHQSLSKAEPPVKLWQKLLPLALIFFCASFNLTILANLKDAIVVTSAGAEALPFLASLCVLPASLAFFFAYGEQLLDAGSTPPLFAGCIKAPGMHATEQPGFPCMQLYSQDVQIIEWSLPRVSDILSQAGWCPSCRRAWCSMPRWCRWWPSTPFLPARCIPRRCTCTRMGSTRAWRRSCPSASTACSRSAASLVSLTFGKWSCLDTGNLKEDLFAERGTRRRPAAP